MPRSRPFLSELLRQFRLFLGRQLRAALAKRASKRRGLPRRTGEPPSGRAEAGGGRLAQQPPEPDAAPRASSVEGLVRSHTPDEADANGTLATAGTDSRAADPPRAVTPSDQAEVSAAPTTEATPPPAEGRRRDRQPPQPSGRNVLPERYCAWNRALVEYCLVRPARETAYLTVTPSILVAAWLEVFQEDGHPEEAEADFAGAVAAAYKAYVLEEKDRLWVLGRVGDDGLPECGALLALSVLAAYEMHSDEEAGPNAFYIRLAELLGVDLVGRHPRGFGTDEFHALWEFLAAWVGEHTEARLALPTDPGVRRFIALPLTHAPLRKMDIEKLPDFFASTGYEPRSKVELNLLERDLLAWARSGSQLSVAGTAAVADDRLEAVTAQVALELESWDGTSRSTTGQRSAPVYLHLDFVRRQPLLQYLARRPEGFPLRFDDGVHVFDGGEEGWYEPILLPQDAGGELAAGFSWTMPTAAVELRRAPSNAIALAPATDTTGFVSRWGLLGGLDSAVLCPDQLAEAACDYLSFVSQRRCQPMKHPAVPDGWQLIPKVVASRVADDVPTGLEALAVGFTAAIVPIGGLRVARRSEWLAGAPPTILISGESGGASPSIDGAPVKTLPDGALDDEGRLAQAGPHVIQAGMTRRRIEVVEPVINAAAGIRLTADLAPNVVALPAGSWTVIGAHAGEAVPSQDAGRNGSLAYSTFQPQWALSAEDGQRPQVLCLSEDGRPPASPETEGRATLTPAQFQTLDQLAAKEPDADVVGLAGELVPGFGDLPQPAPIIASRPRPCGCGSWQLMEGW